MTDKQIIIKRIRDCDNCKFRPETSKVCSDYENCYMVSEYIVNLRKQLRTKEQECEELKGIANRLLEKRNKYLDKWGKYLIYRKTLIEIKEIAEGYISYSTNAPAGGYKQILQKISEVEE